MTSRTALSLFPIGTQSIGATTVHDAPTVSVTSVVTTAGPNLTVQWAYAQSLGVPQAKLRVVVSNAAGSTIYYDSGFIVSSVSSLTVDAVANGIPTDTTGSALGVRVYVRSADGDDYETASALVAFDIQWGVVTVAVTAPSGTVSTSTVSATWTFASTRSLTEAQYRVRLLYPASGTVLYDSSFLSGAVTTLAIPFTLSGGSNYRVEVTARNTMGVSSGPQSSDFFTTLSGVPSFTAERDVGTVYEVGINGMGLMLYDNHADQPAYKYQRSTIPLEADRLATSATPLSETVQRYLFTSLSDHKAGAGQLFKDRKDAAPDAFFDSDGVDPFTKNKLTLLNSVAREYSTAHAALRLTVAGTGLFALTGTKTLSYSSAPGVAKADFNVAAAGTISDLTADGAHWYACDGIGVWRNTAAADPGVAWSAIPAVNMGWGAGRLCVSYAAGGSATPNVFSTLSDAGAEEVGGGRLSLPPGWTVQSFTAGSGHVFFCGFQGNTGAVYAWDVTSAAPFVSWQLPPGEIPLAVEWSQGNVMILAKQAIGSVSRLLVYRGAVQQSFSLAGTLIPTLLKTVDDKVIHDPSVLPTYDYGAVPSITSRDRHVFFSWPFMGGATASGLGAIDLSTSGFAKWHKTTVGGQVSSVKVWQGRLVFAVKGDGVWTQSLTAWVPSGFLRGSVSDGDSNLDKVLDQITVVSNPLAAGESIAVAYSIDGANSYTALPGATLSSSGADKVQADVNVLGPSVSLQVTLAGPSTSTPTLLHATGRYHALGLADTILVLPVDCGDQVSGLTGSGLKENGPGVGAARARVLEGLIQTRVSVQDVDWADTGVTDTYELIQVQVDKVSIADRARHKNGIRAVAVLTLRKRSR